MSALEFIGRAAVIWLLSSLALAGAWGLILWARDRRRARDLRHLHELAAERREQDRRKTQQAWREAGRRRRFADLVVESSRQEGRAP